MIRKSELERYLIESDAEIKSLNLKIELESNSLERLEELLEIEDFTGSVRKTFEILYEWHKNRIKHITKKLNEEHILQDSIITAILEEENRVLF